MVGVAVHPPPRVFGRTGELEILGRLIANARNGQSAVLVVRGESGIGKTELLRHLGWRLRRHVRRRFPGHHRNQPTGRHPGAASGNTGATNSCMMHD
jgi:hypothetical protein